MIITNRYIAKDLLGILDDIKHEVPEKLNSYKRSGTSIAVTCPSHADGKEKNPSCFINVNNDMLEEGTFHCFTCGVSGNFAKFVGLCFNKTETFGANWLINRYASSITEPILKLPIIDLSKKTVIKKSLNKCDETILDKFEPYHPYMTKRGISDKVIREFNLKYDRDTQCIVFPVYNEKNKLSFLTRRTVEGKKFIIDKNASKAVVYGLNKAQYYKEVYVVESQINCLVLWSWGYPAVALLGAGTTYEQLKILSNSQIRSFVLCYDGDNAGRVGAKKFQKYISRSKFVKNIIMPDGKDVADLTKTEFEQLLAK